MNIYDINFKNKLKKYEIVYEKNTNFQNRPSKEIMFEFSGKKRILINVVNGDGYPITVHFKGNTFLDLINEHCSDEDLDENIIINSEIYLEIKTSLNNERLLSNTIVVEECNLNKLIENVSYRTECFQAILEFICTYDEHPSEKEQTLFLLGTTGKLLSEFLCEQGMIKYSRELNGYSITFNDSLNANDYFVRDLVEFINQLGFAGTTLAIDYL